MKMLPELPQIKPDRDNSVSAPHSSVPITLCVASILYRPNHAADTPGDLYPNECLWNRHGRNIYIYFFIAQQGVLWWRVVRQCAAVGGFPRRTVRTQFIVCLAVIIARARRAIIAGRPIKMWDNLSEFVEVCVCRSIRFVLFFFCLWFN